MGRLRADRRRQIKTDYERLQKGGDLVSDDEKRKHTQAQTTAATQQVGAQQAQLNRAAKAAGEGTVMAGALQTGAQKMAQTGADSAIKASGATADYAAALRNKRESDLKVDVDKQSARNRQDAMLAVELGLRMAESGNILGGLFGA